jgi:AcrR family transcriptional regulator
MEKQGTLGKLKEKEREVRQKIIIDAARKVFEKKTYHSVSMAEIAKVAGMAKSSIYTYFSSQEALYVEIAYHDSSHFILDLKKKLEKGKTNSIHLVINHFLDYYILHKSRWRMITHFALHGKTDSDSLDKLNEISRQLMDLFESVIANSGFKGNSRFLAHSLFSSLSGILIAFRNYPGRSEKDRIDHMKRLGAVVEEMVTALIEKEDC